MLSNRFCLSTVGMPPLPQSALEVARPDDGSVRSLTLRSLTFRSGPAAAPRTRPPALSPALTTPCEAARRASCAKARGEGGRVTVCKGNRGSVPYTDPLRPEPEGAQQPATKSLRFFSRSKALAKSCPELLS